MSAQGVLLDLDGTLVDSVYQHVSILHQVLLERDVVVPHWKIHAGIGLDMERLLLWLLGAMPEDREAMEEAHTERFLEATKKLRPTTGALALLDDLQRREIPHHVVTSANGEMRSALFEVLGRELPVTDAEESQASKPAPDPIEAGARSLNLDPTAVTMIGDSVWDGEAATRCGARFIGLRTGGFAPRALRRAGAIWVEDAPRDLVGRL